MLIEREALVLEYLLDKRILGKIITIVRILNF
jgi:hypothetical protein